MVDGWKIVENKRHNNIDGRWLISKFSEYTKLSDAQFKIKFHTEFEFHKFYVNAIYFIGFWKYYISEDCIMRRAYSLNEHWAYNWSNLIYKIEAIVLVITEGI